MPTHQWIRDLTAGTGVHKDLQLFIKSTKTWLCFPAMNIWADTRFVFPGLFSCRIILSGWIVFMNTVSAWLSVSRRSFLTDFCTPSDKQKRPACTFLKAHQTLEIIAFFFFIFLPVWSYRYLNISSLYSVSISLTPFSHNSTIIILLFFTQAESVLTKSIAFNPDLLICLSTSRRSQELCIYVTVKRNN